MPSWTQDSQGIYQCQDGAAIVGAAAIAISTNFVTISSKFAALATVATSGAYSDLSGLPTLGTAAANDVGTSAGNVVVLDGSAKLPAVDGSQLTGLPASGPVTAVTSANGLTLTSGTLSFSGAGYDAAGAAAAAQGAAEAFAADADNISSGTIDAARVPTLNQNTTGSAASLSAITTLGDVIYGGSLGATTRLAGNISTTAKALMQTGTGSASGAPAWTDIKTICLPLIGGTLTGKLTLGLGSGGIELGTNLLGFASGAATLGSNGSGDFESTGNSMNWQTITYTIFSGASNYQDGMMGMDDVSGFAFIGDLYGDEGGMYLKVDDGNQRVELTNLPTSDPHYAGALWNSTGTIKISAG